MACPTLAGVPPVRGLYAACAGLLIYALLGTSRQLNVGPSSGVAILSAATVAPIAAGSSDRYLNLTALLALMTGGLTLAGVARLGFVASLVALVYRTFRPDVAVLGRSSASEADEDVGFRDVSRHHDLETFPGLVIFRFDQEIFFANATFFRDQIRHLVESNSPPARTILVDAEAITHIDSTAIDMLGNLHDELSTEGINLLFARTKAPVRDTLTRAGLIQRLGPESFYPTLDNGVTAFLASVDHGHGSHPFDAS